MTDTPSRRDVLKTVSTASVVSGLALPTAADGSESIRVVEVGIRYDVPSNENYDTFHVDSRPPFTVEEENGQIVVLNTASPSTRTRFARAQNLFDERFVEPGHEVTAVRSDREVTALPTELSSRMRVKRLLTLASEIQHPSVVVHANPSTPAMNVQSEGKIELSPGERTKIELDTLSVEARTTHVVGKASADHVPPHQRALKREEDSVEVEATPIVEAVNHGELVITEQ